MDRMRALEYFIEVADVGSFSKAAKTFGVPASSISRRIQDLEAAVGAVLFHRTTRVVKLTELGALYLEQVRPAVSSLSSAGEVLNQQLHAPSGRLAISAPPGYGEARVVPALRKLRQLYPELVLDIELTDQLTKFGVNDADLAIRATGNPPDRVIARKLTNNRFVLVAAPRYLERYGTPRQLSDFANHLALFYRGPNGVLNWQAKTAQGWQEPEVQVVFISNVGAMLAEEVLQGSGLALVPEWGLADHLETGRLVEVTLEDARVSVSRSAQSGIYLLYYQPKYRLKKIQVAVDFLMQELALPEHAA
ncbi:MAG: LysR family transcriptional regulator [Kordiimonadaceae bacterium]|nr:LysR family transcriptional regulator [Kordiimonadaceae bacterium]MBO6567402.1 LysR family transcriptional regulator [Kordiimonadaceae bacterium]MBO6963384.1 LysR family transcriptional regulator [Kordiimonadaceae bacterium]